METNNLKNELERLKDNLRQESIKFTAAITAKNKEETGVLGKRINKMLEEIKIKSFVLNDLSNN